MTIVNVMVHNGYATLITDTKATSPFLPEFHVAKVRELPHMRIAIATRGNITAVDKVATAICQYAVNYETARSFLDTFFAGLELGKVDVFVVGYDEDKPAAFMISSVNTGSKVVDIPYLVATPTVSDEAFEKFTDDPVANMMDFVSEQCRQDKRCGGWINVTQVGPAVIETYTAGLIHG
ncbi:hypothetical protein A6U97_02480 [Agrobacterium tumefaciens]|uniref:hypothetical protein n=1 Tax=Agrobacterium tumefaciens TaxID=358 RepID=UPI000827829A|nr:hypothetical protein A6U97_02480 [Agrobacterium tumefaciens]